MTCYNCGGCGMVPEQISPFSGDVLTAKSHCNCEAGKRRAKLDTLEREEPKPETLDTLDREDS